MGKVIMSGIVPKLEAPKKAVSATLNDNDWATIREVSDAGEAANYWRVGDTKTITLNGVVGSYVTFSNLSIDAFIIGIDHNADVEGSNRIHFQIGKINGKDVALVDSKHHSAVSACGFCINTSVHSNGGWEDCDARLTGLGSNSDPTSPKANSLLAALPADLRAVMKSVTKYTDNTGNASNESGDVTATTEYLPLLAEFEVHGSITRANAYEKYKQQQYAYYAAGNSKIKQRHDGVTTPGLGTVSANWWLRSVRGSSSATFCLVSHQAAAGSTDPNYSYGFAPAFCV